MSAPRRSLTRRVPALAWLGSYERSDLASDGLAGVIVAVLLVPQAMAYALLAGLPPQAGLYASLLPLVIYALLGTSRVLAVGPVAVVSLLVASGLGKLGPLSPAETLGLAALLALAVGVVQMVLGLARAGFLVDLLSHPVVSGFTSAAALVIAFSQVAHLFGISVPRGHAPWETIVGTLTSLGGARSVTVAFGASAVAALVLVPRLAPAVLERRRAPQWARTLLPRAAPLVVVVLGTLAAWGLDLSAGAGLAVVGTIPAGLPVPSLPALDLGALRELAPTVLAISLVGFVESFAVAQSLANRRGERIDSSQELFALGAANLGAAFTGGYPVTGGFSRTMVNHAAGARSGVASIVTAGLVGLSLVGLTPLLFHLPRAVLAAIIVVAVLPLVDVRAARRAWRVSRGDGAALLATFAGVLALGVETGILLGIVVSAVLYLARSVRPHMAVVGRIAGTQHFRNVERHAVRTEPGVLAIRIDENLYFANVRHLEQRVQELVAERPGLRALLLIASGINFVDSGGVEWLERSAEELEEAGIELHLAEVKGPVLDQLERAGFLQHLGAERVHLSTHAAMEALESAESERDAGDRAPAGATPLGRT